MSITSKANNESEFIWLQKEENGILRTYLKVNHAVIMYRNFSGAPGKFTPQGGKRTFNLVLSADIAQELKEQGWNVKEKPPRDVDEDWLYTTEIVINTNSPKPPHLYLCYEKNGESFMTRLPEESFGLLDNGEFSNIDLIINPWQHTKSKDYTVKGYLHTMWAMQAASLDFEGKYANFKLVNDMDDPAASIAPSEDEDDLPF